jgi:hypothetical protein
MTLKIKGELEIDRERGVIYFHSAQGYTALRICNLPTPIPTTNYENGLDITFGVGCSWRGKEGRLTLQQPAPEEHYGPVDCGKQMEKAHWLNHREYLEVLMDESKRGN